MSCRLLSIPGRQHVLSLLPCRTIQSESGCNLLPSKLLLGRAVLSRWFGRPVHQLLDWAVQQYKQRNQLSHVYALLAFSIHLIARLQVGQIQLLLFSDGPLMSSLLAKFIPRVMSTDIVDHSQARTVPQTLLAA